MDKFFLKSILLISRPIPFRFVCLVGDCIGIILYFCLKKHRKIALSNLAMAFPEKSDKERKEILKSLWKNICKDMLEVIKYCATPGSLKGNRVTFIGKERLDSFVSENKGGIILSAHLGNFPLLCIKLAAEGYPVGVIYRPFHNQILGPIIPRLQKMAGIEPIPDKPRHTCVRRSLAWLKKGGMLLMQIDQNPSTDAGIPVSFFGYQIPTFRGPVILAQRSGVKILPIFIVRVQNNHHQIIIDQPFELKPMRGDNENGLKSNLQALNQIAESYIRQYPSMWWWIHRRFRKAIPLT